jgi:hypothetical protein
VLHHFDPTEGVRDAEESSPPRRARGRELGATARVARAHGSTGAFVSKWTIRKEPATSATLQTDSNAAAVTRFNRPEDGAWDTQDPAVIYFVTTASFTGNSRPWKVDFVDPADPSKGGTISALFDDTEGQKMIPKNGG